MKLLRRRWEKIEDNLGEEKKETLTMEISFKSREIHAFTDRIKYRGVIREA